MWKSLTVRIVDPVFWGDEGKKSCQPAKRDNTEVKISIFILIFYSISELKESRIESNSAADKGEDFAKWKRMA